MKPFQKTIIAVFIASLGGCASTEVTNQISKDYTATSEKIVSAKTSLDNRQMILPELSYPYLGKKSSSVTDSTEELPRIFRSKGRVKFKQKALTAEEFGRLITEETGVPVKLLVDSKNNQLITANGKQTFRTVELSTLPEMEMKQLLSTVAPQFGLDWDFYEGALHLESTFRKSYQVSLSPGTSKSKYNLGKTSNSTAGSSGNSGMSGNFASAMDSTVDNEMSQYQDIAENLAAIAGGKENVVLSKTLNSAIVTCSKDCHSQVKRFVDDSNHILTQQVLLKVNEITVSSTRKGESGINWNIVAQQAAGAGRGYSFLFGLPASVVSNGAGQFVANLVPPAGQAASNFDGSSLLFKAISAASQVVENKPYNIVVNNNETGTLSNIDQRSIIESTSVIPSGVSGTAVFSQKVGYVTYGQLIQVTPTVLPGGNIKIQFGIDDTKIKSFVAAATQGDTDKVTLGGPKYKTNATLKIGSTLVLTGFKVTNSTRNDQGLLSGQRLGSEAGNEETTETIILITPILTGG